MKRLLFLAIFFLILVPIGYYFLSDQNKSKPLPVINPIDVQQEMVDPEMLRMGKGHRIGAFRFQNQDGVWITNAEMKGKVSVVEYFFTTCKGICPKLNTNMKQVYEIYKNEPDFQILSHTCNPDTDSVSVLKHYSDSLQVNTKKWIFLTGRKDSLYQMARGSYLLDDPKNNVEKIEDQFIHTQFFALVDRQGKVRGKIYDGLKVLEVEQLKQDISKLLKE